MRIVIPWRDRVPYLTITLATLKEAMRGHDDVHVTLYNNESQQPAPEICDEFLSLTHRPLAAYDCHHTFINMFNTEFDLCDDDYIVSMDSDCCVHPSFIKAVKRMIADLHPFGHASLYNEGNHPEPREKTGDGLYHVRGHISMTACVVGRHAWKTFQKPKPGEKIRFGCIDGAFSTYCHERALGCYSTVKSYVDHIGSEGAYTNIRGDGSSTAHRARRFVCR